jgi:predicted nucleic acid-binding protein
MESVLLDSDVLLDFFLDREPFSESIAQVLNLCAAKTIEGYTTPLILSNVYYILRKSGTHKAVIEKLKQLLTIIQIIDVNQAVVLAALNSKFNDFEDAIQNYSATYDGNIRIILTRNVKDFKSSDLAITTPLRFLKGRA